MNTDAEMPGYQATGFGTFMDIPNPPNGHTHDTLELSVFEGGHVTMLYGGHEVAVPPNRLVIHWGMLPHQMLRREQNARVVGTHIPLAWALQWALPTALVTRILELDLLIEPMRSTPCGDLALLHDWHRLLREVPLSGADIVLAEARARLLRVAASTDNRPTPPVQPATAFAQALHYIVAHFKEPLRIIDIARASGISPRHLTRTFSDYTGQSINQYITHLRLSYAKRLLAVTDNKVLDIIHTSGFSCATQFYELFRKQTGGTPRKYRLACWGPPSVGSQGRDDVARNGAK